MGSGLGINIDGDFCHATGYFVASSMAAQAHKLPKKLTSAAVLHALHSYADPRTQRISMLDV
jgi:hypothetical protein